MKDLIVRKSVIKKIFISFVILFFVWNIIYSLRKDRVTNLKDYNNESQISNIEDKLYENLTNEDNSSNNQFLHFNHMPITYFIDIDTSYYDSYGAPKRANDEYEEEEIRRALNIIESSTANSVQFGANLVQFEEIQNKEDADLVIYGRPPEENADDRLLTEGLAGPIEFSNNEITKAEVILYATKYSIITQNVNTFVRDGWIWESRDYNLVDKIGWEIRDCGDFPQTEIHEILHTFGFGHNYDNSHSIMAPVKHPIQTCKVKEIDKEIISCLNNIYSNGEKWKVCSNLNMYPWKEEIEPVDFKWDSLPITYTIHECKDVQKWNLQKAEKVIEKYVGYDIYKFQENGDAQINFYCGLSFDDVLLNKETDFWDTTTYFPSAQPYFEFENDKIKEVKIILFAQDRTCGGIEVHELLHGAGLREHYRVWMQQETEMCDTNTMIIDRESINKVKELYGLE